MEDCKYLIEEAGLILLRLFEFQSESSSSSSWLELQLCRIAGAKWNSSGSSSGQIPGATAAGGGLRGVYRGGRDVNKEQPSGSGFYLSGLCAPYDCKVAIL